VLSWTPGRWTGRCWRGLPSWCGLVLPAFGIDLSPEMIAVARRTYPDLRFEVGSMLRLDLPDAALGGVLAFLLGRKPAQGA
jgi:ubiquinone/menaquinone biosynthesis C-methylase UbiE